MTKFSINCTGDVVTGDVILLKEDVMERVAINSFGKLAWRAAGQRIITGEVLKESYGRDKQQHTFTLKTISCEGYRAEEINIGKKLLRKGRNIYRNGTLRQEWGDETERQLVVDEKHDRGDGARREKLEREENL